MPCIIYRASDENELKGKFCPLWGAFTGFSSAREKANEGNQGDPCQDSTLLEAEGRMGGGESGLGIFDLLFHLCFVEWLFFGFCELQNLKQLKDRQKVRKKKKLEKRETFYL